MIRIGFVIFSPVFIVVRGEEGSNTVNYLSFEIILNRNPIPERFGVEPCYSRKKDS